LKLDAVEVVLWFDQMKEMYMDFWGKTDREVHHNAYDALLIKTYPREIIIFNKTLIATGMIF